ncbi:MAG: pyridoxal phosphate-dependent aminotransferase [Acidobacteriota bacterium]
MRFADRLSRLGTETAFDVLVKARALEAQGKEIIHLEIGEPDFETPSGVTAAATQALAEGYTHYCPSPGLPELRQAIAGEVSRTRGISVDPDWVLVTPGAKPIMFYLILSLVNEGDEVLYPNPGFPIYESMIRFVGGKPVPLPLLEEVDFRFDIAEFRSKISAKTKLIILNSPQNPTGGVLEAEDLRAIAEVAVERDIVVLSDEIYSRILYEGQHFSIAALPGMQERTVILDGFSKTFAMTGWRLGYGVMHPDLLGHMSKLVTNSVSCTAPFVQRAGLEALANTNEAVEAMTDEFLRRRDFIVRGLNEIPGVRCRMPKGAFYAFPNIRSLRMKSQECADRLLYEGGVAVLSGTSFGEYGEGYLRLSYANSLENLDKALKRIRGVAEDVLNR